MTRPIPVIMNPTAGGGRLLRQRPRLDAAAAELGVVLDWWPTARRGHGKELASQAVEQDLPLVLAFGGDGTYNEVASGLLGSATAMGVLPGGTASVLVYELAIPRPPQRALAALVAGHDRAMRVGRTSAGQVVLLMVSAGPDAVILKNLPAPLKRYGGKLGIALQAIIELVRGNLPRLGVSYGDQYSQAGWAIVGNSRFYGGPYPATPGADPFSGNLELVLQQRPGRRRALAFALGFPRGRHVRRADVIRAEVERVHIAAADQRRLPYQVDGDVAGHLPVEVTTDPQSLMVRLPTSRDSEQPGRT